MCLRASDPAGHHGLDIMDGVDGGGAVGGGPGFVGIPPYLVRQAQVPFPGEVKNCANLRKSRIRNCPHCRLHPGDRSCRAREEARKGVAVLHREARDIARDVAGIPEPPPAAPPSSKSSATAQWDTSPWRPRHGRRREE